MTHETMRKTIYEGFAVKLRAEPIELTEYVYLVDDLHIVACYLLTGRYDEEYNAAKERLLAAGWFEDYAGP